MEFQSADRTRDAEYSSELKHFNQQVGLYNRDLTNKKLTNKEEGESLQSQAGTDANTGAMKEAGQHASALAQGLSTAKNIQKVGTPIRATEDIVKGAGDTAKFFKKGEIVGKETAQTIGKSAGKLATGLGVIGDVASIGLDAEELKDDWGTMSTMDKITNIADIGGAGLDMVGTGLMTFGGPVGALAGLGMKAFGDVIQVGAGAEQTIAGFQNADDKKKQIQQETDKADKDLGDAKQTQKGSVSLAGAGALAVGRTAQ
tara:strand:- start:1108 stop:1881 length:774 start_codon:yes stop_codon:yes gene_type:complete